MLLGFQPPHYQSVTIGLSPTSAGACALHCQFYSSLFTSVEPQIPTDFGLLNSVAHYTFYHFFDL